MHVGLGGGNQNSEQIIQNPRKTLLFPCGTAMINSISHLVLVGVKGYFETKGFTLFSMWVDDIIFSQIYKGIEA